MSNQTALSLTEEQAFQLVRAALLLDKAKTERSLLTEALETNLTVWVTLRTIINRPDCLLSQQIKDNLVRLCNFAADKAVAGASRVTDSGIDALINVNLQISEGLLEGARNAR